MYNTAQRWGAIHLLSWSSLLSSSIDFSSISSHWPVQHFSLSIDRSVLILSMAWVSRFVQSIETILPGGAVQCTTPQIGQHFYGCFCAVQLANIMNLDWALPLRSKGPVKLKVNEVTLTSIPEKRRKRMKNEHIGEPSLVANPSKRLTKMFLTRIDNLLQPGTALSKL